jgi:hypothetical protein
MLQEIEAWPLAWRRGEIAIYENPEVR